MNKRQKILLSAVTAGFIANDSFADANIETVASALVRVETEAYKADYEDIVFQDLFPIVNLNDRTATSFGFYYVTEAGKAQLAKPDGTIAWVDSFVGMKQAPLHDGNVGYKYTMKELERVGKLGTSLDSLKVEIAIQATLSLAQEIAFYGDESRGIVGFFNNPDIPSVSPLAGAGGNTWAEKTPKEILADINHLFSTAFSTTKQQEFKANSKTNRLILPTDRWSYIATTPLNDNSDTTILDFIVSKSVFITAKENVIASAQIATDTMRIYQKDKKKLSFYWGHTVNFKAPQADDLQFKVPADFSIGGLALRKPLSCWDMEGL